MAESTLILEHVGKKQKNVQFSWCTTQGIETSAVLTVILACGNKDSEEGLKLPKRVCLHQQYVNTNGWSVHYMLTGEDVRLWT